MKTNILSRYLTREVIGATLALTSILLLIFLSQQLVRFLSYAAAGKVAANILLQLMGFEIPYLLAFLLPLGLYLGVIWTYGGLYANNELRIMQGCGFSTKRLMIQTSVLAAFIMALVLGLMLWVNPLIAKAKDQLIAKGKSTENIINSILPGRFQASKDGKRVIYVERLSRGREQATNLFIADKRDNSKNANESQWTVLSANLGYQTNESADKNRYLVAEEGTRYEGIPGQSNYKVMQFHKYRVHVPGAPMASVRQEQEEIPTKTLFQTYDEVKNAAELQWRLSIPLSVVLLAVLAIPLSRLKPRQGRYMQILIAVLIYVVYINLLFVARNWIEQKIIPISLGMWWVHFILLSVVILMIFTPRISFFRRSA